MTERRPTLGKSGRGPQPQGYGQPPMELPKAAPQRIEPLALLIGAFCREYVAPERRLDAVDDLYRLLAEARR